jgi:two-component system, NarL family, sensor histidine kinase UhpB
MERRAMHEDNTDCKQIEDKLRESENQFRIIADFTYDWEYWLNPKGKLIYISPSCERISGYRPDEYYENPNLIEEIVHPDDRALLTEHIHHRDRETRSFSFEFRIITRDGQERWIEHHCQPIIDSDKVYIGERASNRDITKRKQIEQKLRKSTTRLRREVKRRKKAQEELQALYTHLNKFQEDERLAIGRELHDEIGQNLTALNITLTRAARSIEGKAKLALEQAQALVDEVNSQVHDLLANVRRPVMERMGVLPGLLSHIDRYEALTEVKVDFRHRGLDIELPAKVTDIVFHIVQEALTNVARHAGVKQAVVRVRATEEKLKVLVQDRGIGFDPLAIAEAKTTGLSGMSERAAAAGGELKISSSPEAGTRIYVELPLNHTEKKKG